MASFEIHNEVTGEVAVVDLKDFFTISAVNDCFEPLYKISEIVEQCRIWDPILRDSNIKRKLGQICSLSLEILDIIDNEYEIVEEDEMV